MEKDSLLPLGKLATVVRAAGFGSLLNIFRDSVDPLWMKNGRLPISITVEGFVLRGSLHDRSFLAGLQSYELFLRELFKKAIRPEMVVIDGGAHIGLYSLIAARKLRDSGKVLAFEPDSYNFFALCFNSR